ncbi:MAG TPA: hypothetical protein VLA09_10410, partial [Longimicrobiales bacterium]|nr:hypothetical protein [Longimicrobiales bacterium]
YWDELGDIGGYPGASMLENTITSVSGKKDYTDPFFRRGAALTLRGGEAGGLAVRLRVEEHVGAYDVVSDDPTDTEFRPVRTVHEGVLGALGMDVPVSLPLGMRGDVRGELAHLDGRTFGSVSGEALWDVRHPARSWSAELSLSGGALTSEAPAQSLYLLGGRWTLPGHDYRTFVGDRYWLLRGEATLPLRAPYVGVRAIGAVGATHLGSRGLPPDWTARDSGGVRASLGAGLSFGWDAFRVDLARGVPDGSWEALFSVAREFRSWL